jgi:hypothetical protein
MKEQITMSEIAFGLRAKALVEKLRDALHSAEAAINPPDVSGISMDTWNKRLKSASAEIKEAIERADNFLAPADPAGDSGQVGWMGGEGP